MRGWLSRLRHAIRGVRDWLDWLSGTEEPSDPARSAQGTASADSAERAPWPTDRGLLSADEQALFEQLAPAAPEKVVAYPPKVDEQEARDWVTAELERRTGGITRHPMDVTAYPEPPTEQDVAARKHVLGQVRTGQAMGLFSHGMSMRYLGELQKRAKAKDTTLTDEELMGLRSRGLI